MNTIDIDTALPGGCAARCAARTGGLRQNGPMDADDPPTGPQADARDGPAGACTPGGLADSYAQLRSALLAFLRKQVGDPQVAEDLLHDVVVKALAASQDSAQAPHNLTGWLYAVARNAAMDHHRRHRVPIDELPDDLPAPQADDAEAALGDLALCLRPLAERLPVTYRDTLIAAEFDGLALAEVARRQGLSLTAAKTRASRGRRLLQQQLVACCSVALSAEGQVLDYDPRKAATCAPAGTARRAPRMH